MHRYARQESVIADPDAELSPNEECVLACFLDGCQAVKVTNYLEVSHEMTCNWSADNVCAAACDASVWHRSDPLPDTRADYPAEGNCFCPHNSQPF